MIFRGGVGNDEADRNAIEEASFAKIIADIKNQLVVSGRHFFVR